MAVFLSVMSCRLSPYSRLVAVLVLVGTTSVSIHDCF